MIKCIMFPSIKDEHARMLGKQEIVSYRNGIQYNTSYQFKNE